MKSSSASLSVAQRIARTLPTLTRSHRRIADHVLNHPLQVATMPIDELASSLELSVATVNRFARSLGFDAYPRFRAALVQGFESTLAPVEKLRHRVEAPASVTDVFLASLQTTQQNIGQMMHALNAANCERAVATILGSRRIRIIGFGASAWLGGLLHNALDSQCPDVQLISSMEGSAFAARVISRLSAEDLVIAIAFPRYAADTIFLAQRSHNAGIPLLAITDRVTSPLAPLATAALYAQTESLYFSNSEASTLTLIEALCSAVAQRTRGSIQAAAQLAESVLPWIHGSAALRPRPEAAAAKKKKPNPRHG